MIDRIWIILWQQTEKSMFLVKRPTFSDQRHITIMLFALGIYNITCINN